MLKLGVRELNFLQRYFIFVKYPFHLYVEYSCCTSKLLKISLWLNSFYEKLSIFIPTTSKGNEFFNTFVLARNKTKRFL